VVDNNAYEKLLVSASCTADYRFNSYRRLLRLESASNLALVSASTALIIVSVILSLSPAGFGDYDRIIAVGQNCIPIILLAISIMVSGAKYGSRAERMHECAQGLINFKKLLNFKIQQNDFSPTLDEFSGDATRYADLLSKYENHSDIDMYVEKVRNWAKGRCCSWLMVLPVFVIDKGWIYYCYAVVSIASLAWVSLGLYFAFKGVLNC
jgi:hypothetical protein